MANNYVLTTTEPIIITFHNEPHTFQTYQLYNNSTLFYTGRCWFNAEGVSTVRINDVLNNYTLNYVYEYTNQKYVPNNIHSLNDTITKINEIWVDTITCVCAGEVVDVDVSNIFFPSNRKEMYLTANQDIYFSRIITDIVPHIPYKTNATDFWYTVFCRFRDRRDDTNPVYLVSPNNTKQIHFAGSPKSTYCASFEVKEMAQEMGFGTVDFKYDLVEFPILHIDECPSDFYVSFMLPTGGWFSWGFTKNECQYNTKSTTVQGNDYQEYPIYQIYNESFTLRCGYLSKEEYNILSMIVYSPYALVYDTQNNKSYYCTIGQTNHDTMAQRDSQPKMFEIQLNKLIKNIRK